MTGVWRTIDSAPKRGHILVTGYGYDKFQTKTRRRFYAGAMWNTEHNAFVDPWREEDSEEFVQLTHWMPIPKVAS